jgi:DNA polymerase elongation subunit (family B)
VEFTEGGKVVRGTGDPVICIAARITQQTTGKEQKLVGDVLFTWGRCNSTKLANMLCYYRKRGLDERPFSKQFIETQRMGINKAQDGSGYYYWAQDDEANMLEGFRNFIIHEARPHFISGYNVGGFDVPYLIDRAKSLGLDEKFDVLGWSKTERTRVREKIFSSKAYVLSVCHDRQDNLSPAGTAIAR